MTISIDEAEDIILDGHLVIQEVSRHRWYTKRLVVFERGGEMRGFYFLDPATEEQEGQDCFEADPVPVYDVVERASVTYEAVDA